jgi:hypothetical protein
LHDRPRFTTELSLVYNERDDWVWTRLPRVVVMERIGINNGVYLLLSGDDVSRAGNTIPAKI